MRFLYGMGGAALLFGFASGCLPDDDCTLTATCPAGPYEKDDAAVEASAHAEAAVDGGADIEVADVGDELDAGGGPSSEADAPGVQDDAGALESGLCTATCGGQSCVDLSNDKNHCGSCEHDCPASSCSSGKCICLVPNPNNLLKNGGFDNDLAAWNFQLGSRKWIRSDAAGCESSGSFELTYSGDVNSPSGAGLYECVPVTAGLTYSFGGWSRLLSNVPSAEVFVAIGFWSDATCNAALPGVKGFHPMLARNAWLDFGSTVTAVPGAVSAKIVFSVRGASPVTADFDMLYFAPAPGKF
jgi:hypothetical protein